ncbi:hydroxypyruvate isomerase [Algoriphagus ratkowskyi]|uniref:Hydroxypyruvate isomerase n=1 Tax=Algoriphagus ratkowskyi TaxID=57028 RepID=A0A2W7RL26_9BACT|nr:TIM barrel protein [Algoriphagus ratkowskyi]PZX61094.1 hydroxypyruvate isomerase [Algoriphagus ratkowskyi]TXD79226.1 TIM barrel protein [Algoriphagus ratkowskyi]
MLSRITHLAFLFLFLFSPVFAQQKLEFFQTDWGNKLAINDFLERTKNDGYDGIETWFPYDVDAQKKLKAGLAKYDLKVIFLVGTNKGLTYEEALNLYEENLQQIIAWKPVKINSHTGSDYWTLEENKAFIDIANKASKASGIPIVHETHRGRFSYTVPLTLEMINQAPDLRLNLDISHWMVVHERVIGLNDALLQQILPRIDHIHARVGFAQGPQVNNPTAPEWQSTLTTHLDIWEHIIQNSSHKVFTITTEFGPPPYLPTVPFSNVPIADQWEANVFIMKAIKERFAND